MKKFHIIIRCILYIFYFKTSIYVCVLRNFLQQMTIYSTFLLFFVYFFLLTFSFRFFLYHNPIFCKNNIPITNIQYSHWTFRKKTVSVFFSPLSTILIAKISQAIQHLRLYPQIPVLFLFAKNHYHLSRLQFEKSRY